MCENHTNIKFKILKWDYELLRGISKILKPQYPDEYHSIENIKRGNNGPAEITKFYVKKLLKELPPETFIGRERSMSNNGSNIKNIALYTRVAIEDQARVASHLERLRSYSKVRCWNIAGEYTDDGYSGANTNRPDYQRMFEEMDQWDGILVTRMDRIHRNYKNLVAMVVDLHKHNKEFISMTESFDTSILFRLAGKEKTMCEINHCSELDCPANDGKGSCRIDTCALIDPEKATEELEVLNAQG